MEETWSRRDYPVLNKIVEIIDREMGTSFPSVGELAEQLGFEVADVGRAVTALEGEYIELRKYMTGGNPAPWMVTSISSAARRTVGQWPTAEHAVDQLIGDLEGAAAAEPDPEKRGKLRAAAATLGDLGRDIAVDVMAKVIVGSMGHG
jgi:DNA-binding transcriptional regulator YhcF (GntR family)